MAGNAPTAALDNGVLRLSGALDRSAVIALWPQVQALAGGLQVIDLQQVPRVDSAGVALLAELAARARRQGQAVRLDGAPEGLLELSAAYRLAPDLDFTANPAS